MDMREVEDTIYSLENGVTNFDTCNKLASLYIVRDHAAKSSPVAVTQGTTGAEAVSIDSDTEFAQAVKSTDPNTLMEVMVAVMIVGLLTALAVTNVGRYMRRANVTATQQQIVTISQAITQYQFEHNSKLPETLEALTEGDDPLIESGNLKDAWGNDFQYEKLGKKRFKLTSSGPDEEFGTEDDLSNIDTDKKDN